MNLNAAMSHARRRRLSGPAPRILVAGLLLAGSSCQTSGRMARTAVAPESAVVQANQGVPGRVEHAYSDSLVTAGTPVPAPQSPTSPPTDAVAGPYPTNTIYDAIVERRPSMADAELQQVAGGGDWNSRRPAAEIQPIAHAAEQRTPLEPPSFRPAMEGTPVSMPGPPHLSDCPPGTPPAEFCPPGMPAAVACPPGAPRPFPHPEYVGDEYVCDGGDKNLPVHYNGYVRMGLDTEDTIAEWVDHEGGAHVKATNSVCVYAPRFGAVRSATLPQERYIVDRALGHQDRLAVVGYETKTVLDEKTQTDEVKGLLMRSRPSGLDGKVVDNAVHQNVAPQRHIKLLNSFEDFQFVRDGILEKDELAIIGQAIDAALEWSDGQRVAVIAHDKSGQIVQGRVTAQDMTGAEDRRTRGELSIVKLADRKVAQPGDVITFTIRFDNTGGRELFGVRVVDNLSPRLQYIDGSVESNLDGSLDVDGNTAGGQLLTFEFEQPLPGGAGGWISFQCRVR